jgi:hypothetical protein
VVFGSKNKNNPLIFGRLLCVKAATCYKSTNY